MVQVYTILDFTVLPARRRLASRDEVVSLVSQHYRDTFGVLDDLRDGFMATCGRLVISTLWLSEHGDALVGDIRVR